MSNLNEFARMSPPLSGFIPEVAPHREVAGPENMRQTARKRMEGDSG